MALLTSDPRLRREALDARRSLWARATHGPVGRSVARADLAGMRAIRSTARSRRATRTIVVFSRSGEHGLLWLGLGAAGATLDRQRRSDWIVGLASVGGAYLVNTAVKQVARRPRPQLRDLPPLIPTPTQLSFPSSHAASSFAAATGYAGLLPRGPLFALAGAMAVSRVHLGVHYPTDIVVGATLGCVVGRLVRRVGGQVVARRVQTATQTTAAAPAATARQAAADQTATAPGGAAPRGGAASASATPSPSVGPVAPDASSPTEGPTR